MYEMDRVVAYGDITRTGYVDVAMIADYFQDCGSFQSDTVGGGPKQMKEEKGCVWLLASWQIIVDRYPHYGEKLTVVTNPYAFDNVFAERNFMLYDENHERITVANSYWFLVDAVTGMPIRMREDVASAYELGPKQEMPLPYASRHVRDRGFDEAPLEPFPVQKYFIDTNQHVNNTWYIRLAETYLPEDFHVRQMRVEYIQAAVLGDLICPYVKIKGSQAKIKLASPDGKTYAVLEFTAQEEKK